MPNKLDSSNLIKLFQFVTNILPGKLETNVLLRNTHLHSAKLMLISVNYDISKMFTQRPDQLIVLKSTFSHQYFERTIRGGWFLNNLM